MNPVKSRNVVFSLKRNKQDHPPLFLDTKVVKNVECHTHLGLTLQSNMSRRNHIVKMYKKASQKAITRSILFPLTYTKVVKNVECHTHLGLTLQSNMSRRNHIVKMYKKASQKAITRSILFPLTYNRLYDRSLSRRAPVDHTRLRLGFSCQREYLFKINSCVSPICECSFDSESVKHFFLHCPRYAAQRHVLLTSAVNILGETWSSSSDARKLIFYCMVLSL